jgi:hypothetical protein
MANVSPGFDPDFEAVRNTFPKKGGLLDDWAAWCEVEAVRPSKQALIASIAAEIRANDGRYFTSFARWLRNGDWDRVPTPKRVPEGSGDKPKVYRDEWGSPTAFLLKAVVCECGGTIIDVREAGGSHERLCPNCQRNFPISEEGSAEWKKRENVPDEPEVEQPEFRRPEFEQLPLL